MCFIAFYLIIWNCYQDKRSTGWTFYAFACIGLASMVFVQIGYFMPILWIMMMVFTLSFSVKTFFATLVGLIVPYWFAAGYFFYTDNIQGLATISANPSTTANSLIIRRLPTIRYWT